jgi:hypothetical protein
MPVRASIRTIVDRLGTVSHTPNHYHTVVDQTRALRDQLVKLLVGGTAHADFDRAVERFPAGLRSVKPAGAPHSAWELLEHLRLAQWDMLLRVPVC